MISQTPLVRWTDGDVLFDLRPHREGSPWCLTLDVQRPRTGESAAFEWSARFPDMLVQAPPDRRAPADNGRSLLITHSQGIGDFIQQLRYLKAPELNDRTSMLECPPELVELVDAQGLEVELVEPGSRRGDPAVDELSLMRLDQWLPDPTGGHAYVRAPAKRSVGSKGRMRVGLIWSAKLGTIGVESKSVPLTLLQALVEPRTEIDWISVQWGPSEKQLQDHRWASAIAPRGRTIDTVALLASELADLDLLITIDSGPAHLAGALGVPVWTLLSEVCGWRWRLERASSHLYGSMTLVRVRDFGAWPRLIERLGRELDDWVTGARPRTVADGSTEVGDDVPSVAVRLADDPIGTCRSLGLAVDAHDADALACIFQLLVRCYGGFSWCQPEPSPAPPLSRPAAFADKPGFAELIAAATQR